jgi:hypothetical protein
MNIQFDIRYYIMRDGKERTLCFTHAVRRVFAGEKVHSEVFCPDDVSEAYNMCDDCYEEVK